MAVGLCAVLHKYTASRFPLWVCVSHCSRIAPYTDNDGIARVALLAYDNDDNHNIVYVADRRITGHRSISQMMDTIKYMNLQWRDSQYGACDCAVCEYASGQRAAMV